MDKYLLMNLSSIHKLRYCLSYTNRQINKKRRKLREYMKGMKSMKRLLLIKREMLFCYLFQFSVFSLIFETMEYRAYIPVSNHASVQLLFGSNLFPFCNNQEDKFDFLTFAGDDINKKQQPGQVIQIYIRMYLLNIKYIYWPYGLWCKMFVNTTTTEPRI